MEEIDGDYDCKGLSLGRSFQGYEGRVSVGRGHMHAVYHGAWPVANADLA